MEGGKKTTSPLEEVVPSPRKKKEWEPLLPFVCALSFFFFFWMKARGLTFFLLPPLFQTPKVEGKNVFLKRESERGVFLLDNR